MWIAATVMYLNKHACVLKKIKLETTSSQKTSCQTSVVCLAASFLSTGRFAKF